MGTDNTFALTARIACISFTPKAPLRSALGYALLRFQRVLFAIILSEKLSLVTVFRRQSYLFYL